MDADRLPFPRLLHLLPQWSCWPRCPPLVYLHLRQPLLPQAPSQQKPFHRLLVHTAGLAPEVYKVNKNILGIILPLFHCFFFLLNPTVGSTFFRSHAGHKWRWKQLHFYNFMCRFLQLHKSDPSNWYPDRGCGRGFRFSVFLFSFFSLSAHRTADFIKVNR